MNWAYACAILIYFFEIQSESFQRLRSFACQLWFDLYNNGIVASCAILVWTESFFEAGLKLCMCNLFAKITFISMSNQTCQYMILNILRDLC